MRSKLAVALLASCVGVSPALAFVEDYEIVSDSTPQDSASFKAVDVACPVGTSVLGGGATIFGSPLSKSLVASQALLDFGSGDAIGWHAEAQELIAEDPTWQLTSYAICGVVPGLERVADTSATDSDSLKGVDLACPAGKSPISGGFQLAGQTAGVGVYQSAPVFDLASGTVLRWDVSAYEYVPTSGNWSVRGELFCADLDTLALHANSGPGSEQYGRLELFCPASYLLLGGGGTLTGTLVDWTYQGYPSAGSNAWRQGFQRFVSSTASSTLEIAAICPEPAGSLLGAAALGAVAAVRRRRA